MVICVTFVSDADEPGNCDAPFDTSDKDIDDPTDRFDGINR